MPAADSSSSRARPEDTIKIEVTLSLDGVVLNPLGLGPSLSSIAKQAFDYLEVTLVPRVVGAPQDDPLLSPSLALELIEHERQPPNMRLLYRKRAPLSHGSDS